MKYSLDEIIFKFKTIHGNKYDFSKVEYVNSYTNVCVICPIHGEFFITPKNLLRGCGCPKCSKTRRRTKEEFIEKAKQIHGDDYDYSNVEYINNETKVCIICKIHGEFWQTPHEHLSGKGCQKCGYQVVSKKITLTTETFIEKAKEVHGDDYDYSEVEYKNSHIPVCIICPIHGEFWQKPNNHLNGRGCPKCAKNQKYTTEEYIIKAKKVHGDLYDYSKTKYINSHTKICIICREHGEFWQMPYSHLNGCGCNLCKISHLEQELKQILIENDIEFEQQKHFDWLGLKSLDYYLPKYNIAIECQGIQHFKPIEFFGGINEFIKQEKRDKLKKKLCQDNNITLLYFIGTNKEDILKYLKK